MPEAGVVDEHFDGPAAPAELLLQTVTLPLVGEVGSDHLYVDAVLRGELGRQAAQPLLAARHQDQ